jgi:hypothetical protein
MRKVYPSFEVYKGLQKPIVFKSFKGKYIYWGVGSILIALIAAMLVSSLVNLFWGLGSMSFILGAGLGFTAYRQQRGPKKASNGIIIIPNNPTHHED